MGEYGGVVRQSTSTGGGGGGGGSYDPIGIVMDLVFDVVEQIASQPPEMLLVLFAAMIVGGLLVFRRA